MRETERETERERERERERLLLENVDRHLEERKARSQGIQHVQGPARRRKTEDEEEEGGEELKRRGVEERGRGGPVRVERERERERQIQRSTDSSGVQSAACRLATESCRWTEHTCTDTHTPEECMRHAQAAVHGHIHSGRAPERTHNRPPSLRSYGEQHVLW
ncbi:hypothetical protein Q8A73_007530 [Channa argus]|nr:hypothetical protein Q8A73_007530 [Channa argus]